MDIVYLFLWSWWPNWLWQRLISYQLF